MALAALGGYGRAELTPGSDVDLLFLHPGLGDESVRPVVDAVLYPLWDAGMRVSHAVRTVEECVVESRTGLPTLTALMDARRLEGSSELVEQARSAATDIAGSDPRAFAAGLLAEQVDRNRRFGTVWRTLQPDLKESVGGLRDIQVVRWAGAVGAITGSTDDIEPALDLLLRARTALHVIGGRGSNRLAAEHQGAVAASLGYADAVGWEARDALMRDVFDAGRRVHATTLQLESEEARPQHPRSMEELLRGSLADPVSLGHPLATEAFGSLRAIGSEWVRVKGRPQRDPYHRYPVDVHLIETVAEAARLLSASAEPFAAEAVDSVGDPMPLLVGAFLHDIGKVGAGSHVDKGIAVARDVLGRMGIQAGPRDDILFLVGEHLLLADTATRRNLEDEGLIVQVAARIGDRRRLAMLYLLTVADALATGPSAATPWRMALIRDLVAKVDRVFERGLMDEDRAGRLAAAARAVGLALSRAGASNERVDAFMGAVPPDYLLWVDPEEAPTHLDLIDPPPAGDEVRTHVRRGRSSGTYRVAVGAVDRLGLLAAVAGSFTLAGLSILSARAFTTEGGIALDVFDVRGAFEEDVDEHRWDRFRTTFHDALTRTDLAEKVRSLRSHYRPTETYVPVTVRLDQEVSDFSTVVEVGGSDRLGLLFDLAKAFSDQGLDVHVAKVSTYGPRVVDVFYVREEQGQKLDDGIRAAELVRALTEAASGGG